MKGVGVFAWYDNESSEYTYSFHNDMVSSFEVLVRGAWDSYHFSDAKSVTYKAFVGKVRALWHWYHFQTQIAITFKSLGRKGHTMSHTISVPFSDVKSITYKKLWKKRYV